MNLASRAELLTPGRRRYRIVTLPDGREVRIRSLNELEKSQYETAVWDSKGEIDIRKLALARRRLLILCLVDEAGEPLFTNADMEALGQLDGNVTDTLYRACREHCGFGLDGQMEALAEKNSGATVG